MNTQTELKITGLKTRRVKGRKTDKNSPILISSDWKRFNVPVSTQRSDLPPCAQLKTPLMPGAHYVRGKYTVVTASTSGTPRKLFDVSKVKGTS